MNEQHDQDQNPTDEQKTYTPLPKNQNTKIWLLTIIIHLIIGLILIGFWHYYHPPKPQPTTHKQPVEPTAETPMKTAVIASIVASTTLASTTLASTTKASAPKTATASTPKTTKPQPNNSTPIAPNATGKIPTPASTPTPTQTTTTTITKKVVHEAPVTQALTERDIPTSEKPKNTVATAEQSKEANELSEDIDAKNKELSNLINQVKKQNQQKIDKEIKQPIAVEKPTTEIDKTDNNKDKQTETEKEVQ